MGPWWEYWRGRCSCVRTTKMLINFLQKTAGGKWHSPCWKVTPWKLHQCWGEKEGAFLLLAAFLKEELKIVNSLNASAACKVCTTATGPGTALLQCDPSKNPCVSFAWILYPQLQKQLLWSVFIYTIPDCSCVLKGNEQGKPEGAVALLTRNLGSGSNILIFCCNHPMAQLEAALGHMPSFQVLTNL